MLQTIRERAQGWIAWAIVILISIPFALWGIQSYLGVGGEPVAATVNGQEITERELDNRYRQLQMQLREQLGDAYRPELFADQLTKARVLDEMVRSSVLIQASVDLGLRASAQEVRAAILRDPAFQSDGRFDNAAYERMLQLQGMVPLQYEQSLSQQIVGSQLARAVIATEGIAAAELEEYVQLARQRRNVRYVLVPKSEFESSEAVSEEEVAAYYEANKSQFQIPERVKVQYLVVDTDSLAPKGKPSEEEVRDLYATEKDRFTTPERRRVRHVLISLDASADKVAEDAAKEKAGTLRQRIEAGEDFAALAKEMSQDTASAKNGGDLGFIERGLMDPAFESAAFSLQKGQLSDPVRTRFGYHLIEVTEIEDGATKPLNEVKSQLIAELEKRGSEGRFFDQTERLANLSYESPDSLEPAAEALGLKLQTSGWIDRQGGQGLFADPKIVAAAFSDEVLKEGNNSDLIEPDPDKMQAIVLRVAEHQNAAAKPLDQVRDQIQGILRDKRAADAAAAKAAELDKMLTDGQALKQVAGAFQVEDLGLISRDEAESSPQIREFAFTLAPPKEGGTSHGSLSLANGDAATVVVTQVLDGSLDNLEDADRKESGENLAQLLGRSYYEAWLAEQESNADIERNIPSEGD